MNNREIAKIFYDIADILELKNEDPFRVRAYRQAAKSIEFSSEEMVGIFAEKGLDGLNAVPDIGESLAEKIAELLKTGKLKYFEKIKKTIPVGELVLTQIPGVGPKVAERLYKKLKIESIEELQEKLEHLPRNKKGEREIDGLKEKSIENILRGIEIMRRLSGRIALSIAFPIAEAVVRYLKKHPAVKICDAVGSLRRMKETVGDVDIICAAKKSKEVIDYFVGHPDFQNIIAQGDTKATVIHKQGIQLDLEILPAEKYGSLLQHFTGSKEHNIALRTWAEEHGMSVSEHGVKILDKKGKVKKLITCPIEERVYKTLGMDYISPELRENSGEIEAAREHKLPKLVELKNIRGDLHVHTNRSGDGHEEPEVLIKRAQELGYEYIAFTEHTKGLGVAGLLNDRDFLKYRDYLHKLNRKYPKIKILAGCEANIKVDGSLDVPDEILKQLDFVVASVHSSFFQEKSAMTKRVLRAIRNPYVQVIGHPSGRHIGQREEIQIDWPQIFRAAAETGTALEINAYPTRLDLKDIYIRQAMGYGVKFIISTDTHQLPHLDFMKYGVAMARRGWAEKEVILNTLPAEKFLDWVRKKRNSQ